MAIRKPTNKYYFSVEGQTEKWYLEWLESQINKCDTSFCNVSFDILVEKNPLRRVKRLNILGKTTLYHLCDYEGNEPELVKQFRNTLDLMKRAEKSGRNIQYKLGYSNLTFDLWIILHKIDCQGHITNRKKYRDMINRAYNEQYESMDDYKHERNFKACLQQLTLSDVREAINRAAAIMKYNDENGYNKIHYHGYCYYEENPSLEIWLAIKTVMEECGLT